MPVRFNSLTVEIRRLIPLRIDTPAAEIGH